MLKLVISFFILVQITSCLDELPCECANKYAPEPDYYWRPFNGTIPYDAIKGGDDSQGAPTYIGQMPIPLRAASIPATIVSGSKDAHGVFVGSSVHDEHILILCTRSVEKFRWVKTKAQELHLLSNYYLIVGGYETALLKKRTLYIGRVNYENSVIIGKVSEPYTLANGLIIAAKDGSEKEYDKFEVLTFVRS